MNPEMFQSLKKSAKRVLDTTMGENSLEAIALARFIDKCVALTINKPNIHYIVIGEDEDINNLHRDLFGRSHR